MTRYINLSPKNQCPRPECMSFDTTLLRAEGPTRVLDEDNWPVRALVTFHHCNKCGHDYENNEVVE